MIELGKANYGFMLIGILYEVFSILFVLDFSNASFLC